MDRGAMSQLEAERHMCVAKYRAAESMQTKLTVRLQSQHDRTSRR